MRKPPPAEAAILAELDRRGMTYSREFPVHGGKYFCDIFFKGVRVDVEVDGPEHRRSKDEQRDRYMREEKGIVVLRFKNREAIEETTRCVDEIAELIERRRKAWEAFRDTK